MKSLEDQISEKSNQLISKVAEGQSQRNNDSTLETQMTDLTRKLDPSKAQNATDKPLLECVPTALASHMMASLQRISN